VRSAESARLTFEKKPSVSGDDRYVEGLFESDPLYKAAKVALFWQHARSRQPHLAGGLQFGAPADFPVDVPASARPADAGDGAPDVPQSKDQRVHGGAEEEYLPPICSRPSKRCSSSAARRVLLQERANALALRPP